MTNFIIKHINITAYRTIATLIVLLPIVISYTAQWSLAMQFMVFPLVSLMLTAIAKYIDFHIINAMLITTERDLVNTLEDRVLPSTIATKASKSLAIQVEANPKAA